jgi:hypothetical protein
MGSRIRYALKLKLEEATKRKGTRKGDLRVLTTLTNSHTANGVSWSPVLNADHQLLFDLDTLRDVPLVAYLMSSPVRSDIPKSQSSGVTTTS